LLRRYGETMKIKANDRLLTAGKTGSGKTWFVSHLLAGVSRLVVVDPKANLENWGLKEPSERDWSSFDRGANGRFRVLPPITENPQAWYEDLFERLYNAGSLTLYIDEAYAVSPPGSRPGQWLSALYTRGRELGIGVWSATQRPAWIPLFMISEADWLVTFRLSLPQDRDRMASIAGEQVKEPITDEHGFWLYHVGDDRPVYYKTAVLQTRNVV
jgi:DNA helicase HerA-like ATPase